MKSCLKYKNDIKNDSFEIAENYINMFSPRKEKKIFILEFIHIFCFQKDHNKRKNNNQVFTKTYIKSL